MAETRVALLTGSTEGLGKMTALLFAEQKWTIAVNSRRSDEKASRLLKDLRELGAEAQSFPGDVTRRDEASRVVAETLERFGRIDVLVHAVGPFIRERKLFVEHSGEEVEQMIHGNLLSAIWMAHAALPVMRKQKWGRVIFFGFGRAGEAPAWPDRSVYAAAKTGLVSLTKTLAVEEAPNGISVNMVCPGDIVGEKKEMRIREVSRLRDEETPRGRPGSGEDVARVIRFLTADASDFVTGNIINVTGGLDVIHPVSKKHPPFSSV
ncbi:SDR family oxidoreductase [Paenactinomyces guangxiensis]|uniref:SDR family oxidoreductase n=1 Tax=Paenactinomyces guangxiensis TaxID=1490290 RepID=A0A7W1WPL0_9BACL|nr:SDR family oxidoreductase [Paenactinomyces guangxiensis]MBA4493717.1 SDR family oxidoreductase [Paenactinomyces guangxiensis]MBH8591004.1 SDR family oxidoreductase [Paenactinomyces guangxiensis]